MEFIDIKGTVRPKSLTLQYEPGRPYPQEPLGANGNTRTTNQYSVMIISVIISTIVQYNTLALDDSTYPVVFCACMCSCINH